MMVQRPKLILGGDPDMRSIWDFFLFSELWGIVVPKTVFCPSGSVGQFFYGPYMISTLFLSMLKMVKFQNSLNMVM